MRRSPYWLIVCTLLVLPACDTRPAASAPSGEASGGCAVTQPPAKPIVFPTPDTTASQAYADQFFYGTTDLWTMLPNDGTWSGLPKSTDGYGQKVFWWSAGYSAAAEPQPNLTVTGKRLDGEAGPLAASPTTNASANFGQAMLVGVTLPTTGCWEITGRYRGQDLTFVVKVVP
jgi:hypothetical protein